MAKDTINLDRVLTLELARVTEAAALAASHQVGRGDEKEADQVAVDAMRTALNTLDIDGTVVIGEGERDEAPMLFIGEEVGSGEGPKVDIAVDPLEGTTICAKALANALAVIAGGGTAATVQTLTVATRAISSVKIRLSPAFPLSFAIRFPPQP